MRATCLTYIMLQRLLRGASGWEKLTKNFAVLHNRTKAEPHSHLSEGDNGGVVALIMSLNQQ